MLRSAPQWREGSDDSTEAFEAVAGDAPTTARLTPVEGSDRAPELWRDDDTTRVLRPRTEAARRRPLALSDDSDPAPSESDAEVSPAHRALAILTSPRVIVGGIFVLLIVALVLIFSGIGPVG